MKEFRTIVINNRQEFERLIRKNLDDGFKMINSNISVYRPIQRLNNPFDMNPETKIELVYYAYMEKERS